MISLFAFASINFTAWISHTWVIRITDSSGWLLSHMFLALEGKRFLFHRSSLKRRITRLSNAACVLLQLRRVYSREDRLFSLLLFFCLSLVICSYFILLFLWQYFLVSNCSLSFDLGLSWLLINNLPPFCFLSWLCTVSSPALFRFLFWYSLSSLHCSRNFVFLHFPDEGFPLLFLSISDSWFQAVSPGFLPNLNRWLLPLAFLATFALNLS